MSSAGWQSLRAITHHGWQTLLISLAESSTGPKGALLDVQNTLCHHCLWVTVNAPRSPRRSGEDERAAPFPLATGRSAKSSGPGRRVCAEEPVSPVEDMLLKCSVNWVRLGLFLLVLLFGPKQNLRNLEKQRDQVEPGPPALGAAVSLGDEQRRSAGQGRPPPPERLYLYFIKRARRLAESAARLFHGCGSRARSQAWKTEALDEWSGRHGGSLLSLRTRPVHSHTETRPPPRRWPHQQTPTVRGRGGRQAGTCTDSQNGQGWHGGF